MLYLNVLLFLNLKPLNAHKTVFLATIHCCQILVFLGTKGKVPMEITTTANQPFKKCCLDLVGPLLESKKRTSIS
jgi:hypothetical protein